MLAAQSSKLADMRPGNLGNSALTAVTLTASVQDLRGPSKSTDFHIEGTLGPVPTGMGN